MSLKLKAVEYAEKTSKEAAARYFGVDDKSIWEWSSQSDKLAFMTKGPGKKSESGYMELAEKH